MSGHTKEPWFVFNLSDVFTNGRHGRENDGHQIADCSVDFSSDDDPGLSYAEAKANARRIVACVNALQGVSTEHLEKYGLPDFAEKISALQQQRDQLLAALKFYANPEVYKPDSVGRTPDITHVAREAIASAGSGHE